MAQSIRHIILFDGVCNLCNGFVKYIIRRDKKAKFKFASIQSNIGRKLLLEHGLPSNYTTSFVYIHGQKMYLQSDAALRVARELDGVLKWFYWLIIVPPFIRNFVYKLVAKNRYRLFGRRQTCMIPSPNLKERFMD